MSVTYVTGDATHPQGSGMKIIVHLCGDVGGWEQEFAQALSRRWPDPERQYHAWSRNQISVSFQLGRVQFVRVVPEIVVANLLGRHGGHGPLGKSLVRYEAIRQGLRRIAAYALTCNGSVHMPRIGCGRSGGKWDEVARIVEEELSQRGLSVFIYDLPWSIAESGTGQDEFRDPRPPRP